MSARQRAARRLIKAFLPIILLVLAAFSTVTVWIVHGITRPPHAPYLVTPQTFSHVTGPILKANDATWRNHDGTSARGWVLEGAEGAPAVILLHQYGADRSWLLNLAVKLHETTNFTVLWPDLRGHGENPLVSWTLFGAIEGDDVTAAIDYLHSLKSAANKPLVSARFGVYGIELGAYAGLDAARRYPEIRALALDSAPGAPDDLIRAATSGHAGMNNAVLQKLANWGIRLYSFGKFENTSSCALAQSLRDVRTMLLAGGPGDPWQSSTVALSKCFSGPVELKKDLPLTGISLPSSTGEQEEGYDRPVIEFFDKALR